MPDALGTLGVVAFSYMMFWQPQDTLDFLEHCHAVGASGIQCAISGDTRRIRTRAEQLGMYIEAVVPLPDGGDTSLFEQSLKDARDVNAVALRAACLPTRRYETFATLAEWKQHVIHSRASIQAALPLLDKYKIPLGLENHKDWTADELEPLMQKYATPYFGVCLDFGNAIALLDDPITFVDRFAPYAVTTHIKDMAVEPCPAGFLLSEVPLGQGFLPLPQIVSALRRSRPGIHFSLEMITRDPLTIPCLSDGYWATFPDRAGLHLARTLRFVHQNQSPAPLPRVSHLSFAEQRALEDQNVITCLRYAHDTLGVSS